MIFSPHYAQPCKIRATVTDLQMTDLSDLAHLVSVQPEAAVSRTAVLYAEGTNVVLFAASTPLKSCASAAALPVLLQAWKTRSTSPPPAAVT